MSLLLVVFVSFFAQIPSPHMKRTLRDDGAATDADDVVCLEQDVAYLKRVLLEMHGCMDSPSEISVHYYPTTRDYYLSAFGYCRPVRAEDLRLLAIAIESTRSFSCQEGNSVYVDMLLKAPHHCNQGALVMQLHCAERGGGAPESRGRKRLATTGDEQDDGGDAERPRSRSLVRSVLSAVTGL
jgi:hypothetical protein